MGQDNEQVLKRLSQAAAGLLFMSESDYPFALIQWDAQTDPTAEFIRNVAGEAEDSPVEKLEAAFVFEIADPPRQSGLADAQTQCCLRDRTEVGHRDEGPQALQVHRLISKMHKE